MQVHELKKPKHLKSKRRVGRGGKRVKKQGTIKDIYRVILNMDELNNAVKEGDIVNVDYLLKNGLVRKYKGMKPRVKLLSKGKLTKRITVERLELSKGAKEQIEKIKGTVK